MKYTGIRAASFAVFHDREFESTTLGADGTVIISCDAPDNPDPSSFRWNDRWKQWAAEISALDCERVYRANAYAKYQGHLVNIMSVDKAKMARVYYSDYNKAWAEENGFEQVNKYEFEKSVPAAELYDVFEKRDDLLFLNWRDANFVRPPGVEPAGRRYR